MVQTELTWVMSDLDRVVHVLELAPEPEPEPEEPGPVSAIAGWFPHLPPTPKPFGLGAHVPDRTARATGAGSMAGNVLPKGHVQVQCAECGCWQGGFRAWCDQCGGDLP
jgi:hypothetical protein